MKTLEPGFYIHKGHLIFWFTNWRFYDFAEKQVVQLFSYSTDAYLPVQCSQEQIKHWINEVLEVWERCKDQCDSLNQIIEQIKEMNSGQMSLFGEHV